jgi:hypothetical protein
MKTAKVVSILGRFQGSFRAALFASAQPHSCKYKNKSAIKRYKFGVFTSWGPYPQREASVCFVD